MPLGSYFVLEAGLDLIDVVESDVFWQVLEERINLFGSDQSIYVIILIVLSSLLEYDLHDLTQISLWQVNIIFAGNPRGELDLEISSLDDKVLRIVF